MSWEGIFDCKSSSGAHPDWPAANFVNNETSTDYTLNENFSPLVLLPILEVEEKSSALYEKVDNFTLRTKFSGDSIFSANTQFETDNIRLGTEIRLVRDPNGTPELIGPIGSTGAIRVRLADSSTEFSIHIASMPVSHAEDTEFGLAVGRPLGGLAGAVKFALLQTSNLSAFRVN